MINITLWERYHMKDRKKKKHRVYMNIAHEISSLSTCDRKHVGSVVVKDDRIVSMGYNGAPSDVSHCNEEGHLIVDGHCRSALHSEINALLYADRWDLKNATIYVTCRPCIDCLKAIINSGIQRVIFEEEYDHDLNSDAEDMADEAGLDLVRIDSLTE